MWDVTWHDGEKGERRGEGEREVGRTQSGHLHRKVIRSFMAKMLGRSMNQSCTKPSNMTEDEG